MSGATTSWPEVTLGQICEFRYGKSLPEAFRTGGHVPVFGSNGQVGSHEVALTIGPTIVIGRKGSTGEVNFSPNACWPIDTTYYIDATATQADVRWLAYRLAALGLTKLNKSVVPGLNRDDAYRKHLLLPPLPEQRRIAEVLDRAEALRAKRRAALAQLDTLTQSIFLDMFGDPAARTQRFLIQPLGTVLKQSLQNGAYYPKESYTELGGVEMVHMSDAFYEVVPRGQLKRVVCTSSDVEKYALCENDILIARRSLTLEGAAKPCLIPRSSEPLIFESSFIRVTPKPDKLTALYLYHYLNNDRVKQKCVRPFITQSTISGINQSNLERVSVIVPPLRLQREFGCRVASVDVLKMEHRASLVELDTLFATLQHRAFRGDL